MRVPSYRDSTLKQDVLRGRSYLLKQFFHSNVLHGFDMVNANFAPVVGMVYASPSYTVSKFFHARKRTTHQWKSTIRLWTRKGIPEKYYFALTMLLCMSCVTIKNVPFPP